jgi:glycosyltransferase involved in cell wall biosynthesis
MKILMVFQGSPYPPDLGPAKRNTPFFLENLKRHDVSVLSVGTPEEERKFREMYAARCKRIVFVDNTRLRIFNLLLRVWNLITGHNSARWVYNRRFARALHELIDSEKFDLIHCCTPLFGWYRLPEHIPLVGDAHNVAYDFFLRMYQQSKSLLAKPYLYMDYLHMKREEPAITDKFDVVLATTEVDKNKFRQLLPRKRVEVIPNGVDSMFLEPQSVPEEPKTMVFTGLMSYQPNHQGITYFLDEIFPLILEREPDARIWVVGALPPKSLQRRANHRVKVTGWVDDIRPYFARGQVFVIPLLVGGGIRGKALEAMAMKKPIVTTSLGCEGIDLHHQDSALFADTPKEFADAVIRLFNDGGLRRRLTEEAFQNLIKGYSWEANGEALDRVYQSLVRKAATASQRTREWNIASTEDAGQRSR